MEPIGYLVEVHAEGKHGTLWEVFVTATHGVRTSNGWVDVNVNNAEELFLKTPRELSANPAKKRAIAWATDRFPSVPFNTH